MDSEPIFMWFGYIIFALVMMVFLGCKCWNFCQKSFGYCKSFQNVEVVRTSGGTSPSNSFSFIPSLKEDYISSPGVNSGLTEFNDNIIFDQPMLLASPYSLLASRRAESGYASATQRDVYQPPTGSSRCKIIDHSYIEDDQHSINHLMNSFNKSVLSINSSDEFDKEYCEGPTLFLDECQIMSISAGNDNNRALPTSGNLKSNNADIDGNAAMDNQHFHESNRFLREENTRVLPSPFLSNYVSDIL